MPQYRKRAMYLRQAEEAIREKSRPQINYDASGIASMPSGGQASASLVAARLRAKQRLAKPTPVTSAVKMLPLGRMEREPIRGGD